MSQIAFLFPGQGAFYVRALRATRLSYRGVEQILNTVEGVAQRRLARSLLEIIWSGDGQTEKILQDAPDIFQLAIYTISVSNFEILRAEGISPEVLVGHSFGEIAALVCAGVFSVEQGAEIVCDRIESLAAAAPHHGCMAAVSAGRESVRARLADFYLDRDDEEDARIQIAVENHRSQTVVSGHADNVAAFVVHCGKDGIAAQRLKSPYAFHHTSLAQAANAFSCRVKSCSPRLLERAVYSPILGRYYRNSDNFGDCLARHLTMPVKFHDGIRFLQSEGVGVYVECGALDALSKIVIRITGPGTVKTFPGVVNAADEPGNIRKITQYFKEINTVNVNVKAEMIQPDFEVFWRDSGAAITAQIKLQFEQFVQLNNQREKQVSQPVRLVDTKADQATIHGSPVASGATPNVLSSASNESVVIPRNQLFDELVAIYAEAMEYPIEVFTEEVELEAELGIDSVKQTEIIQRISKLYRLPPLPASFRSGDFKSMGQIVDFVYAHQGAATMAGN
ncbi:acyltransferase domain-containing protein [Paraburkholderia ginsengisoli]|uniref:[acyl-carrier-protein] S-malonyltransferase n=1 Tax=Paraburkholderia ginsengisoli TaxID=311231 RepID=A0A7T4TC94_9BURK|nr:acyltransferase domain-containing protein [Paraburkholderia ginsengisoli]QQC68012.1 acyltransferase domain-containing protein [Paraburkholderia ginsengisoli]